MAPGLVSHVISTHRFEPSLSNSWMSCSATTSRCALLAPTRWSMHAFLFLFPVSFRAGFGLFAFVQCLFSLGLPFFLQLPRALLVRVFSVGLAAAPFSPRRLFGFARHGLLSCHALVSRGPLLFLFPEASSSLVTLVQAFTVVLRLTKSSTSF